ncbi:MAG: 2-C-methyl-D-erythritol 4-phosphate cytidylyltransferase, partial [Gammaproteobacteria bacterium]|nr:2-C-methyl-D-erythritol 4-phosphate cytidylyltransferase [Gammaproteobacteria bacterium]
MAVDTPKQYLPIGDRTVIEHTLDALLSCRHCHSITVAVAADDARWPEIGQRYANRRVDVVHGGDERSQSVLNALEFLLPATQETDWVLVHDAARPCLR